ncbi:MAG: hypothetical protein ACFCVF_17260 [Kineosporiaceae bacterium]
MADAARAAWDLALDGLEADLDRVERTLAGSDQDPPPDSGVDSRPDSGPQRWTPPPTLPAGLADPDLAALRRRLATLQGRQNALVSRLTAAMTENRRHRALLDRAARGDDRPLYVDRRA